MNSKVALVIIFNHRYDKNIPTLEKIYKSRFTNIFYLMPFYDGDRKDVIPVYENSYYFQGYIAQGFKYFYNAGFEHYFFIGDDLVLNPIINENNYKEQLHLTNSSSFLPGFVSFHECGPWPRIKEAYEYNISYAGVEAFNELPSYSEAAKALGKFNLYLEPMSYSRVYKMGNNPDKKEGFAKQLKTSWLGLKNFFKRIKFPLSYPLIGSYADIFVVSSAVIEKFIHYCGVFAATRLHVEIAIPTALVLSGSEIVTEKEIELRGKPLWSVKEFAELDLYNLSLNKLLNNFPAYLYLHPIKLSKWKLVS